MPFIDVKHKGVISNFTGNGIHCLGAFEYFQTVVANETIDVATRVGIYSSNDSGSNLTEIVLSPTNISISAPDATLSNVTVWTANSILTQGRGDGRYYFANNPTGYITAACLTYANITGTPNLSLYLTTANAASTYLPSANFTYANIGGTIPTATNTTLGAVKVGSNLTIANGVLSATSSGITAAKAIAYSIILGR